MRVIERRIDYASRSDTFKIIITSCWHIGNRHCREDVVRRLVKEIKNNEKTYFIALGDMCDYISIADIKRREFSEMALWLFEDGGEGLSDIARAENIVLGSHLKGIGHKCIAICEGNHEESIRRYSEHNAYAAQVEMLADGANAHQLDHAGLVNLRFKREQGSTWTLPIHATHGSGSGSMVGSVDNKLKTLIDQYDGISLHLMGHWHDFGQVLVRRRMPGQNTDSQRTINAIAVPSLCGDMKYAENKDKRPLVLGYWEMFVTPDKERVEMQFKEIA